MEMEKGLNSWNLMINELTQGRELAKQLQNHLHPSSPDETREYLIEKILSTYNNALQMANLPGDSSQISFRGGNSSESPHSVSHCSSRSAESSDPETHPRASKKRKTIPRLIKTVKVSTGEGLGAGLAGSLNDGYNWRKYGQKDILGATFPRNYYRCTHRRTQGCFATKQIQKTDEDPTTFQVIYKGHHTCSKPSHLTHPSTTQNPPPVLHELAQPDPKQEKQNHSQQTASNKATAVVQPQLKVETEDLDSADHGDSFFFQSFSFSSDAPVAELADAWFVSVSPATSDSAHLHSSPGSGAGGNCVWTPESDFNDQGGSGPDSPMDRLEFTLDELGIDPNFPFDNPEIFS